MTFFIFLILIVFFLDVIFFGAAVGLVVPFLVLVFGEELDRNKGQRKKRDIHKIERDV